MLPVIFSVPPYLRLLISVRHARPPVGIGCRSVGADPGETNVTGDEWRAVPGSPRHHDGTGKSIVEVPDLRG